MKHKGPRLLAIVLAAAGFVVSGVLEYVHIATYLLPGVDSFCTLDATFDCTTVTLSRWSVIGGVPLPVWGAAGFAMIGSAVWRRSKLALPLTAFAALASIALLLEALLHVGAVCLLCEAVHLLSVLLFGVALWQRAHWRESPDREAWLAMAWLPVALVLSAMLIAPRYWEPLAWQTDVPHATGVDDDGNHWVGAAEPEVIVEEWVDYRCPHCATATNRMRMRLVHDADELRVVRRHDPRLRCTKASETCLSLRAALCAAEQDKFWQMDSWLFVHAPGNADLDVTEGARTIGLDPAPFIECLDREATWATADGLSRAARKARIVATPTYVVEGKKVEATAVHAYVDERL